MPRCAAPFGCFVLACGVLAATDGAAWQFALCVAGCALLLASASLGDMQGKR